MFIIFFRLYLGAMMINWAALIREDEEAINAEYTPENGQNSPLSGEFPTCSPPNTKKVGSKESIIFNKLESISPLSPPSPPKNRTGEIEEENETRAGCVSTGNFCDSKTHPASPVAVCLLLACCADLKANKQEVAEALVMLKTMSPPEQVRAWAMLCKENDIDPDHVQQVALPSLGEGVTCCGCNHLGMSWVRQAVGRRVFKFVCDKQHAVLELGFAGERVLIAPHTCHDYEGRREAA